MRKTYQQKIEEAKRFGIAVPEDIATRRIVGVYGFFAVKNGEEDACFYIGKSTNIIDRIFRSSSGHVSFDINGTLKAKETKIVPKNIDKYLTGGYKIEIRILEEVDYTDTSFSRASHRLALAELTQIVKYQEGGHCLEQRPEGTRDGIEKDWADYYKS